MIKTKRSKFKVSLNMKKELSQPRKLSVGIIFDNSKSKDFDEAKVEWQLENAIDETADDFSSVCDLCHCPHLKYNFIIHNPLTGKRLRVGSTCIIRFGLIEGNVDFESGAQIINNFVEEKFLVMDLRALLSGVMTLYPYAKDVADFYKALKKVLEIKQIKDPTVDQLGDICYGENWNKVSRDIFIYSRLKMLWEKPGHIDSIKSKVARDKKYKEGTTWGHKQRTGNVHVTMAGRDSMYKVDRHVERESGDR